MKRHNGNKHLFRQNGTVECEMNSEMDDINWDPKREVDGDEMMYNLLSRRYKWQLTMKEWQEVHRYSGCQ